MADVPDLPPETRALAELAGSLINATFDKALEGDLDGFDADVDAAMDKARPALADDDAARHEEKMQLGKQAMRVNSAALRAMREGRGEDEARLDAEFKALQARIRHLTIYHGFTAAAERLHMAKDFDAFMAALPGVDLTRLYGRGHNKETPPFPLFWAMEARTRPLERVQAMLNAGARLDLVTRFPDFTLLHWIAQSRRKGRDKRLAILRLLVLKGADLEARDWYGRTPLHVAIDLGSVDDLAILLQAGADPRALGLDREMRPHAGVGRSALMMAADSPDKMRLLLDHGADPAQRAADGTELRAYLRRELALAEQWLMQQPERKRAGSTYEKLRDARAASLALIEPLLGPRPADPGRKLTYREAPELFHALQADLPLDEWRKTLDRVDINTFHAPNGDCPIYWPIRARIDRPQRLWLMLQAGASVKGDRGNGTALHYLASLRRKDAEEQGRLVQILVQAGAELEAKDYGDRTPLARAIEYLGFAEIHALLAAGASLQIVANSLTRKDVRETPLIASLLEPRIFRLLLDHGADPDQTASDGTTLQQSIASGIERLMQDLTLDLSGNARRITERQLRAIRTCQSMLLAKDATPQ